MSVHERRLRLAPEARGDIRGIRVYGLERWGVRQANAYRALLQDRLETLRLNPLIGSARDAIYPGLRALPVERHVIYYRVAGDAVEVVRILHERVDPGRHLRP